MGKVSPKEKESKTPRQRRRTRTSNNKYLRPGALAQLRYCKAASTKSCTDLGKKRIVLLDSKKTDNNDLVIEQQVNPIQETPMMSPEKFGFSGMPSPLDFVRQHSLPKTPKTPQPEDCEFDSRLESLPMDLMVKILCHLHHDQLKAVFHVSQRVRKAVSPRQLPFLLVYSLRPIMI
ncbi:hypothetical protein RDABS01_005895 [Bienertia sinuspersici]